MSSGEVREHPLYLHLHCYNRMEGPRLAVFKVIHGLPFGDESEVGRLSAREQHGYSG